MLNPIQQDEINFNSLIERLKNVQQFRDGLLQVDFNKLKQMKGLYAWTLMNFYRGFCFFPDEEIKMKLKSSGLFEEDLIYFTPLQDVLNALTNIWIDKDIFHAKTPTLELIRIHYETKISAITQRRIGLVTGLNSKSNTTITKKIFYNLKRRKVDQIKNNRKQSFKSFRSPVEESLYILLSNMNKFTGTTEENEDIILKISDGNTKNILRQIVECHDCESMSNDAFLRKFYPLFRLIVKDGPYLPDEAGFYQLSGYLGKSFEAFQTIKVKDIIY